jgi:hypothetical protein
MWVVASVYSATVRLQRHSDVPIRLCRMCEKARNSFGYFISRVEGSRGYIGHRRAEGKPRPQPPIAAGTMWSASGLGNGPTTDFTIA